MMWYLGMTFMWLVYFPILSLLKWVLFVVPKVRERMSFEFKNKSDKGSISFRSTGQKADLCFEFSSEGEYQQVASLIDDALEMGKKLELVFFSPSVERTILDLYAKHQTQIRYLRYPILGLSFSSWVTASELILVRYDLFPEFLIWSLKAGRKLKFVWVTFKKERVAGKSISSVKRLFLQQSVVNIYSSKQDAETGLGLGIPGATYDFRMEQIKRRIDCRERKFANLFPQYGQFHDLLSHYPRNKRLILGNAWPIDLGLLKNLPQDVFLVIVPHQLKPEIIESMKGILESLGRSVDIVADGPIPQSQTLLINKKGILCELYSDFGKAYVGGGFGESVHSLLEPLVAGSEHLSCGPVNHRSTEFDMAQEYGKMKEVKNSQEFMSWLLEDTTGEKVHDKLRAHIEAYPRFQKDILSC